MSPLSLPALPEWDPYIGLLPNLKASSNALAGWRRWIDLTMISLTTIACLSAAAYVIWRCIVYPAFVSPLSKIPNAHFSAPFSPAWILWKRYSAQENKTVHAAHEKHGKIVRLGPNDVSVASVDDGIRIVYGGGFEKWAFYPNLFDNFG